MYIHIYIENIRSSDCWRDRKTYFEDLAKGNFPLLLLPLLPRERIDGTGARATKLHIYIQARDRLHTHIYTHARQDIIRYLPMRRTCSGQQGVVRLCKAHRRFFRHPFRAVLSIYPFRLSRSWQYPPLPFPLRRRRETRLYRGREISPDISPAREMSPIEIRYFLLCVNGMLSLRFSFVLLHSHISPFRGVWFMGSPDICLSMPTWGRVDDPKRIRRHVYVHAGPILWSSLIPSIHFDRT